MWGLVLGTRLFVFPVSHQRSATNNGGSIWLLDAQDKLKDARLDGLDISLDAVPPREILPSNVTFRHWNIKDSVPEHLIGAYDIVHVRFLAYVILSEELPAIVAKLLTLLKPGGYLQWAEADFDSMRFEKSRPECKTEHLTELFRLLAVEDPRLPPTWVTSLPELFAEAELVDVERGARDPPPHLVFLFHEASLMIHELIARKTTNEQLARELRRLLPGAVEETRQGAYGTALRVTVIGRKPESEHSYQREAG
jgi:hypothetical protein